MPDGQSRWFYIVRQLQVAVKLSTKVAGNHLLLSVTRRSVRCRSGSEISSARLYERQGAEGWSRGVEGCGIRDELIFDVFAPLQGIILESIHAGIPRRFTRFPSCAHCCV